MANELIFRADALKPVVMDVKNNGGGLRLVGAEGIYLTAEKPSYVGAKRNIAYAEGFDLERWDDIGELFVAMDEATGIQGAIVEDLSVEPETLELLIAGVADLAVSITCSEFLLVVKMLDVQVKSC